MQESAGKCRATHGPFLLPHVVTIIMRLAITLIFFIIPVRVTIGSPASPKMLHQNTT